MSPDDTNQTPFGVAGRDMEDDGVTDGGEGIDAESHTAPSQRLSCEQCRQRKVRCDRRSPCTPCSRKQIHCSFPVGFKPRQKRHRALVSNSYEDKIDDISRKLDRICVAVDSYNATPPVGGSWRSARPSLAAQEAPSSAASTVAPTEEDAPDEELGGELSLTAHAAFATDYVQQAMRGKDASPEMTTSLEALRRVVGRDTTRGMAARETHPQLLEPRFSTGDMRLPPIQFSMSYLQKLRTSARLRFHWTWELESVGQFVEYLLPVYSGGATIAEMITVNAGLYRLFGGCVNEETQEMPKNELKAHAEACRQNLESILARLPFNLPSNYDYVLALFNASTHYLEACKPSLSWKYLSAASQMGQILGFHRDVALVPETDQSKLRRTRLFWFIVIMDKCLVLRLNRPSTIKDSDLTLSRAHCDDESDVFLPTLSKWIDWSRLQGRIYDDIFSPGALLQPESLRTVRARALATELQNIFDSVSPSEDRYLQARRRAFGEAVDELFIRADRVSHLAILTLIYRSIPPTSYSGSVFCEECVTTAHEALEEHQHCLAVLKKVGGNIVAMYIQWAILTSPLVPFIVLFCRVVETSDPTHLDKLASVVEALQMVPEDLPEAWAKQQRLFKLMYDVACRYVESKGKASVRHAEKSMSDGDFEMFFKEAGIVLPAGQPPHGAHSGPGGHVDFMPAEGSASMDLGVLQETFMPRTENHGAELANWFDQNHQMFRMIEDGL